MSWRRRILTWAPVVTLVLAGCAGDTLTQPTPSTGPPTGIPPATSRSDTAATSTTTRPEIQVPDVDRAAPAEELCALLLSRSDVDAFIGAPGVFDVAGSGWSPDAGGVVCSWSSVDDSGTPIETLEVRLHLGDPVPAGPFYEPGAFPEIRVVDGLGEEAFFASSGLRRTAQVLDTPIVVVIDYWPVGVEGVEGLATGDDMIDLLRTVHGRFT